MRITQKTLYDYGELLPEICQASKDENLEFLLLLIAAKPISNEHTPVSATTIPCWSPATMKASRTNTRLSRMTTRCNAYPQTASDYIQKF